MQVPADVALVNAARAGDRQAVAELLRASLPVVYNVIGRALNGHPDVDDVVQETMVRVVQGLPALRDPARYRSWLVAIAIRQLQDRERDLRRTRYRQRPLDETQDPADPSAEFVDHALDRLGVASQRRALSEASRWLSPHDRRVLALCWQESAGLLTRAELADALGLSTSHAAVQIHRMKAHLHRARAVVAALAVSPRCASLTALTERWDRQMEPRSLKRLSRHVRGCQHCSAAGRFLLPAEELFGLIGLVAVPTGLLASVPGTGTVTVAKVGLAGRLVASLTAAGAAIAGTAAVLGVVLAQLPAYQGDGATIAAPPPPPATLGVSPTVVPPAAAPTSGAATGSPPAGIYLSPAGSDEGDGTLQRPYATLGKAVSVVRPGQTIYLRGGTYRPTKPVDITVSGTAAERITLTNHAGETPVIDASQAPAGRTFIIQQADYWTVRGIEIVGARHQPYVCESCRHNVFQRLSIHDNRGTGLTLRGDGTVGNQVLDSDFFANYDVGGRDADGIAVKFGSGTGNVIRGCRTYHNVDDGVELSGFDDPVTIDQTWSYGNGVNRWNLTQFAGSGNGFRLSGGTASPAVAHLVTRSAAWHNGGYGFTESGNSGTLRLTNNTAFRNAKDGFAFFYSPSMFQRNLALGNNRQAVLAGTASAADNSWNQDGWSDAALRATDPGSAEGPRDADGSLPSTAYLTNGKDPDVGAPMGAVARSR